MMNTDNYQVKNKMNILTQFLTTHLYEKTYFHLPQLLKPISVLDLKRVDISVLQ